ncbi:BlaI/MecI/CopY family transcriptional regulator [Microbacterium esteraromaticum]|uniref:BlaI/MecI/CopY family transcriptional regulator n=1 Tax=Microbacterium esteraromaticum TaxID=57043 RepID=UPI001C94ADA4|nr:BlaI/MecI/CopY family transcriptional regulator [Microbacterium esteraromaticum]MBY6062419.1 BlaI/MecI/CopY family transcriptional regulator [Microbacterium esteraromaticum]
MSPEQSAAQPCGPLRLGALEQQVMDALWDDGPLSIREVITRLGDKHAYTTIATVLGNLERKQLVVPERRARAVTYTARCTRELHAARLMEQALDTSHDRDAAILHFFDAIDERERDLLRDYLARREPDR